ncbi:MAG: ASKHA domain-containing protein [Treponema sp.]|nr:ASKHA domain-containing protein [Treponema sp.]
MLCKICHHCGLCEGDGRFKNDESSMLIETNSALNNSIKNLDGKIGIAVDIGTTTIVASSYSFPACIKIADVAEVNAQRAFGADVISRIKYAKDSSSLKKLHDVFIRQLSNIFTRLLASTNEKLARGCSIDVLRIVFCGNTSMLSIAMNIPVTSLASYPFEPASLFGDSYTLKDIISDSRLPYFPLKLSTPVFIPACISAFIGADTVCAMLDSGFGENAENGKVLADVGTNCEMAIQTPTGEIFCTSSAAGSAFEAAGIKEGMAACEGAIAASYIKDSNIFYRVIGGGKAKGICGTGLLSVINSLVQLGKIEKNGAIASNIDFIELCDNVKLYQADIRNFQLAKAAVYSGLSYLMKNASHEDKYSLYLAGGFGTKLNVDEAVKLKMIPEFFNKNSFAVGNAALSGAAKLLFNDDLINRSNLIQQKAKSINLALEADFQNIFISSIDF